MKKAVPEKMFNDDQSRLTTLRNWVLENEVTEIEMSERQSGISRISSRFPKNHG